MTKKQWTSSLTVFFLVTGMIMLCAVETHWVFAVLGIACLAAAATLSPN